MSDLKLGEVVLLYLFKNKLMVTSMSGILTNTYVEFHIVSKKE